MKKKFTTIACICLCILIFPLSTYAHSGRTDSSGGHHDYKNVSGLGSYHYHHGYPAHLHPGGVCPYGGGASVPTYTPPPSPSVTVRNAPTEMNIGDSAGLDYTIENATSTSSSVTSNNEAIVKVNDDKTLSAIGEGVATIAITGSGVTKSFNITVKSVPVSTIVINNLPEKIQMGKTAQLDATVLPDNATDKTIEWSSSDENIISISEDGSINGNSIGSATITCRSINDIKANATITVYEVFPTEIKTNVGRFNLECKDTKNIDIQILPEESNNKSYDVYVRNERVARVVNENNILALNDGKTDIIIRTHNGISKIIPIQTYHVPVKSVSIDDSNLNYIFTAFSSNTIDTNSEIKLKTIISPKNATFDEIEWISSDDNVASIVDNKIKAIGTGNVELTATTYDKVEVTILLHIINKNDINFLMFICIFFAIIYSFIIILQRKNIDIFEIRKKYMKS